MPDAHATPSRSVSMSTSTSPESAQASMAATMASCAERSRRRAFTRSSTSVGSTLTRPAILTGICSAHSSVRWRTPEVPARRASHVLATSPPTGLVVPIPVTTTLVRLIGSSFSGRRRPGRPRRGPGRRRLTDDRGSGLLLLDVPDGVADGLEVLHLVIGDGHAELLLSGDHDLDHRQRVDVEVLREGLVELDVVGVDAGDLVDEPGQAGADLPGGYHGGFLFRLGVGASIGWCVVQNSVVPQGTVITWAAYARPAPNAISSAVSPGLASPLSTMALSASGMEAADVLPWWAMSRAIATWGGSLRARAIAST